MRYPAVFLLAANFAFTSEVSAQPPPSQGGTTLLDQVIQNVKTSYSKRETPVVVFDVDGTLLDNRPRHLKILREYGQVELKRVRPDDARKFAALTVAHIRYSVVDTLDTIAVKDEAVRNNAVVFWSQRFRTNDYLKYDVPTRGSVEFVRTLYSNGARIVYLTGRDIQGQFLGTTRALYENGLPIGIRNTELIMKPVRTMQNAVFKSNVTRYLQGYGKVVATFDNEPANANVYRRAFPDAIVVLYEAAHSPSPPPLQPNIRRLPSFAR